MDFPPQTHSHYPTWHLPLAERPPTLTITPRHACGYFPDRFSTFRAFDASQLTPAAYQELMDAGFRRSGTFVYQPMCTACRDCRPIRVPTATFTPTKSQRRVLRKNADLVIRVLPPQPTMEKWELYDRYQRTWHDGKQAGDPEGFLAFLYTSPVQTLEFEYRLPSGRLVGVGLCDLTPSALSSVYFYFDPDHAERSPGTFSALYELAWAREMKLAHWYAGYWVPNCRTMHYKANYQPAELLDTDGTWRPMNGNPATPPAP